MFRKARTLSRDGCFRWLKFRYWKKGNKKRATCFETLLQNVRKSDVARFTTLIKPILQQIRGSINPAPSLYHAYFQARIKNSAEFLRDSYVAVLQFKWITKFNGKGHAQLLHPSHSRMQNFSLHRWFQFSEFSRKKGQAEFLHPSF